MEDALTQFIQVLTPNGRAKGRLILRNHQGKRKEQCKSITTRQGTKIRKAIDDNLREKETNNEESEKE